MKIKFQTLTLAMLLINLQLHAQDAITPVKEYQPTTKVRLTKLSLAHELKEQFRNKVFSPSNPLYKTQYKIWELKQNQLIPFQYVEAAELDKNGLAQKTLEKSAVLNPGISPENARTSDYHDTLIPVIKYQIPIRVYFKKLVNTNKEKNKDWYLVAEFTDRTLAIQTEEFLKGRNYFAPIWSAYLDYLKTNEEAVFLKVSAIKFTNAELQSIQTLQLLENAAEYYLQGLYLNVLTGSKKDLARLYQVTDPNTEAFLNLWQVKFQQLPTNYQPLWSFTDSLLYFHPHTLSQKDFLEMVTSFGRIPSKVPDVLSAPLRYVALDHLHGFEVKTKINLDNSITAYLQVQTLTAIDGIGFLDDAYVNCYTNLSEILPVLSTLDKIVLGSIYRY